jgi:mono/diheme cytochrome c family protein
MKIFTTKDTKLTKVKPVRFVSLCAACALWFTFAGLQGAVFAQVPAQTQTSTAAGSAQAGRELYVRYSCYACHGYDGHGGAGARLVPMRMTGDRFTAYVRSPRTLQMPAYSTKLLTDAQLADVWAYIKSMPISPEAKDIPLLARIMSGK